MSRYRKWTPERINEVLSVLKGHTTYAQALEEIGESSDAIYKAFARAGLEAPTVYLAQSEDEIQRRSLLERNNNIKTILVFNDVHIPFHNEAACRNVLQLAKDMQPDHVVINGDLLDCYSLSRFPQQPGMPNLQDEIDMGSEFLWELRRNCPIAKIDYLEGNHEERLKRVLVENHGLFGLKDLSIPRLLNLEELNITYHSYKHPLDFLGNRLSIVHGHRANKHAGASAKAHLLDDGYYNVVVGHTHRMGAYYHDGHYGRRRGIENGGLFCKEKLEYIVEPNWQNGFCVIHYLEGNDKFLQFIPVEMDNDGTFIYKGVLYQS
jgi:predicted phosphodiesterase